jgi:quercetin dioxygenase-like cupin family protein/DNA-binding XRE family transcriptional regulator
MSPYKIIYVILNFQKEQIMTEQIRQIAERIKEIREISGISAETLAIRLGVTKEQYNSYESGNIDIPVGFVFKVSELFNIELSVMLGGDNPKLHVYGVVRNGKGLILERRKQYRYESLASNFINKKAEPFMVTIDPRPEGETLEFNSHPGQEFNYVIKGTMMTIIDGHEITLNEGDSIYFDSGCKHAMKALDNGQVRFLAIVL